MTELRTRISDWMKRHEEEGVRLLQELIRVPSTQGNEWAVQQQVAGKLRDMGLAVEVWEPDGAELAASPYFCSPRAEFKGSPNVVGVWKGSGGGRSIVLNGHVDVVPPGDEAQWDRSPWSGHVEKGKVYGRGSTDMKGGNVSLLLAVQCLKELGVALKGDVLFHSVVEEESGGAGTLAAVLKGYRADAAIIPEPTNMRIFPKQQGSMWFRITVFGRSAHGGTRYEGVSAVEKSMTVFAALQRLEAERNAAVRDPLYAGVPIPVPINVGVIRGGDWPSSVPDNVKLEGRMGVFPEESLEEAKAKLETYIRESCSADPWLAEHPPQVEWFGARWVPGAMDPGHELVTELAAAIRDVTGREAAVEASPWGTDGGLLGAAGQTPAVVFGPGVTERAHFPNEYIEIGHMMQAAEIIAITTANWCGIDEDAAVRT